MNNAEIIKTLDCPYYEDENILFLNTDCMKLMELLPDKFFDLAICDPEYGINMDGNKTVYGKSGKGLTFNKKENFKKKNWDDKIPEKEYFYLLKLTSKNQIIWGGNYFTEFLKPTKSWIFWYKKITNPNESNFSDGELAWTSFDKITKFIAIDWIGFGYINSGEKKIHTSQKPIALYLWLLDNYAKPNDLIYDSHVGSASSLIACMQKGFKIIGCELDADYFNDAVKRIKLERAKMEDKFYLPENENNLFKDL